MKASKRTTAWVAGVLQHGTLLAFTAVALLPLYFMLVSAFKTRDEFLSNQFGLPQTPVVSTLLQSIAGGDLYRWVLNSLLVTVASVLLSTAVAALAAFPIGLMK